MRWQTLMLSGALVACAGAQSFRESGTTFVALGDVNLGRVVGQRIIAGDTLYPFRHLREELARAGLVFANLESQLTDQGGETQDPGDNYIFCGPREAAVSLLMGGIDVVSTANNHAYDYGRRGLMETLAVLREEGISQTGLSARDDGTFSPAILECQGVRVGVLAYTEFVNRKGAWGKSISVFNKRRAGQEIRALKKRVDLIVASYHGGAEYAERPPTGTLRNLRSLASLGADIVVGHHPHVPQGVEQYGASVILYSLGNAVFAQPQRYWTQTGMSVCVHIRRDGAAPRVEFLHLDALKAGLQPTRTVTAGAVDSLERRFAQSSPSPMHREGSSFIPYRYAHTRF